MRYLEYAAGRDPGRDPVCGGAACCRYRCDQHPQRRSGRHSGVLLRTAAHEHSLLGKGAGKLRGLRLLHK